MQDAGHTADDQSSHSTMEEFEQNPDQMKLPGGEAKSKKPRFGAKRRSGAVKKVALALLVALLLGAAGFAAWKYLLDGRDGAPNTTAGQAGTEATQTDSTETSAEPLTETYSNEQLRLDFKYPASWKVSEGAGGIRIESPEFAYQTAAEGEAQGYFRVYIRMGAREADSKYIGRGVAISPSEKLSYTDPVPGQRKDTFLSAFGLDASDNFNFFLIAGNFKLSAEDTLGPGFGKEADAYIIAGGYSDKDNSEDLQMNSVSTDNYGQTSAYKTGVEIVKSLQLR